MSLPEIPEIRPQLVRCLDSRFQCGDDIGQAPKFATRFNFNAHLRNEVKFAVVPQQPSEFIIKKVFQECELVRIAVSSLFSNSFALLKQAPDFWIAARE